MRESLKGSTLQYPANLVEDIYDGVSHYQRATEDELIEVNIADLTPEQIGGLNFALTKLTDKQREVIKYRYEQDMTFTEIGKIMSVSNARIRQVCIDAVAHLSSSKVRRYIRYGIEKCKQQDELNAYQEKLKQEKAEAERIAEQERGRLTGISDSPIDCLPLSAKSKRELESKYIRTVSGAYAYVAQVIQEKKPFSSSYPAEIVKVVLDFKRRALTSRPHWEETEKGHRCSCCLWETKASIADHLFCPHCGQKILTEEDYKEIKRLDSGKIYEENTNLVSSCF